MTATGPAPSGAAPPASEDPSPGRHRREMESLPRPKRAFGPVAGSVLALGAWAAVAHNSGAGWVQALGALMGAFLVIGLVAPAFIVRRVRCYVDDGPFDGAAGAPFSLTATTSAPVRLRPLAPPGDAVLTGPGRACPLVVVPPRRGVLHHVEIEVANAAPFGLLWWTKRVVVELVRPVCVAPRLGRGDPDLSTRTGQAGRDERWVNARVGEPRGARSYQPGDLRHWVHWPATAHAGGLMVREMETEASRPVVVSALLPDDPIAAEEAAEVALGTVDRLLSTGSGVVLVTAEPGGPVEDRVADLTDAGRRLARALPSTSLAPTSVRRRRRKRIRRR